MAKLLLKGEQASMGELWELTGADCDGEVVVLTCLRCHERCNVTIVSGGKRAVCYTPRVLDLIS